MFNHRAYRAPPEEFGAPTPNLSSAVIKSKVMIPWWLWWWLQVFTWIKTIAQLMMEAPPTPLNHPTDLMILSWTSTNNGNGSLAIRNLCQGYHVLVLIMTLVVVDVEVIMLYSTTILRKAFVTTSSPCEPITWELIIRSPVPWPSTREGLNVNTPEKAIAAFFTRLYRHLPPISAGKRRMGDKWKQLWYQAWCM